MDLKNSMQGLLEGKASANKGVVADLNKAQESLYAAITKVSESLKGTEGPEYQTAQDLLRELQGIMSSAAKLQRKLQKRQ